MSIPGTFPLGIPDGAPVATLVAFGSGVPVETTPPFRDFLLGRDGDLVFTEGDLTAATDVPDNLAASAQEITIALRMLLGEWFMDESKGVPWSQKIFGKNTDLPATREILRQIIAECSTVKDVPSLVLTLDRAARMLTVTGSVSTVAGAVDFSIEVP